MKIGDVVQLKSGGPAMTVTQIKPGETPLAPQLIVCTWYFGPNYEFCAFPCDVLHHKK